ncbi:MAG: hypothetical protein ABEH86_01175, partial [Haloarcula sp.]
GKPPLVAALFMASCLNEKQREFSAPPWAGVKHGQNYIATGHVPETTAKPQATVWYSQPGE